MRVGPFDSMNLHTKLSDTLIVGTTTPPSNQLDCEAISIALLDVERQSWVMYQTTAAGAREIIASLQAHIEELES